MLRGDELLELLQKPTAKENATVEKFRMGGTSVKEYCPQLTKEDCCRLDPPHLPPAITDFAL